MANNTTPAPSKQPSGRASVSGGILSVLSLILAAIGYGLAHAHYNGVRATTTADKIGNGVSNTTVHVLGSLFSLPFLVLGIIGALLALLLTLGRLGKAKGGGVVVSVLWILVNIWTISIVMHAFHLLKAHS